MENGSAAMQLDEDHPHHVAAYNEGNHPCLDEIRANAENSLERNFLEKQHEASNFAMPEDCADDQQTAPSLLEPENKGADEHVNDIPETQCDTVVPEHDMTESKNGSSHDETENDEVKKMETDVEEKKQETAQQEKPASTVGKQTNNYDVSTSPVTPPRSFIKDILIPNLDSAIKKSSEAGLVADGMPAADELKKEMREYHEEDEYEREDTEDTTEDEHLENEDATVSQGTASTDESVESALSRIMGLHQGEQNITSGEESGANSKTTNQGTKKESVGMAWQIKQEPPEEEDWEEDQTGLHMTVKAEPGPEAARTDAMSSGDENETEPRPDLLSDFYQGMMVTESMMLKENALTLEVTECQLTQQDSFCSLCGRDFQYSFYF